MADKKISQLTNLTGANLANDDEFAVVDTSVSETKAITYGELSGRFTADVDAAVTAAQAAQAAAEAAEANTILIFDQFGDQYLGPKASDPTVDNDGNPLVEGAIYYNTVDDVLKFYSGTAWTAPEVIATTAANNALASEQAAATSASNAATSETNAATSETNAANSAAAAAASFDEFDDRYLGAKASDPATDNDGDPLVAGAVYFNTTTDLMRVYNGSSWADATSSVNGTAERNVYTATGGQTTFSATYDVGYVDVYLNGVKLVSGTDFTATNGTSIVLASGATAGDTVDIIAYGAFSLANHYTKTEADSRFVNVTGDTMTGGLNVTGGNVGIGTTSPSAPLSVQTSSGYLSQDIIGDATNGWSSLRFRNAANTATTAFVNYDNGAYKIGTVGSEPVFFSTANTERLRIDSSGNVGIGNTTPSSYNDGSDNLVIGNGGSNGISIHAGVGMLHFTNVADTIERVSIKSTVASNTLEFTTGGAERARIDASGNLLVGTTDPLGATTSSSAQGIALSAGSYGGLVGITRSNGNSLSLNRITSDGAIATFSRDGSTIGRIGATSGSTYYTTYVSGVTGSGITGGDGNILLTNKDGASTDGSVDLGASNKRVRNLYLSGGVYLGGTGAANYLDDYEEGTWTPTTATSGYTISSSSGFYTKVGNLVTLHFRVKFSAVATNNNFVRVQGRPFSPSLGIYQVGVGRDTTTTGAIYVAQMDLSGSNDIVLNSMDGVSGGVNRTFRINEDYDFNLTYRTS